MWGGDRWSLTLIVGEVGEGTSLEEADTYLFFGEGTQVGGRRGNLPSSSSNALYLHLGWGVRNSVKM